jgi:DNA-binding NarL/FixJ family response regulator
MSEQRSRVLLADDHPVTLAGLCKLLEPSFEVVGRVTDGLALLVAVECLRPDLVIAGIEMPGLDGLEATRRLQACLPEVKVLILSLHAEPSCTYAALDAGAWGCLPKTAVPEEIERAVKEVLADRFYLSPVVVRSTIARTVRHSLDRPPAAGEVLTPRELNIVRWVGQGLGSREIAGKLHVSVITVRSHLNKICGKLGLTSRMELALLAMRDTTAAL